MRKYGFTIVELLIVIVVIGVLATISAVTYGGISTAAKNTARINELVQWQKLFEVYRAQYGQLPPQLVTDQSYCLGKGFPTGAGGLARCRDVNSTTTGYPQSDADALMTELSTIASLPSGDRAAISGVAGPYVTVQSSQIRLMGAFYGMECPKPAVHNWTNANSTITLCNIVIAR